MEYQKLGHFSQKSNTVNLTVLLSGTYKWVKILYFEAGYLTEWIIQIHVNRQLRGF
jgi:hypothetical protein